MSNLRYREILLVLVIGIGLSPLVAFPISVSSAARLPVGKPPARSQRAEATAVVASTQAASTVIVAHDATTIENAPVAWLDQARVLDIFFTHKSIGGQILEGMEDLAVQDPARYTIDIRYGIDDGIGITHYQVGANEVPYSKIDGFADLMRSGPHQDVAFMKFCVSDVPPFTDAPPEEIWEAYRAMMEALQADYPDTIFVWWTIPLIAPDDSRGNTAHAVFNARVRDYVQTHGGVLFDIADIQSHDPDGNLVVNEDGEASLYPGYATYDGAHLNALGSQRVAGALWWLLARLAGWSGPQTWIDVNAEETTVTMRASDPIALNLAVLADDGSVDPVHLTLGALPPGVTASFFPNPVQPVGSSQLALTSSPSTPVGTYALVVTGTAGSLTATEQLTLNITSPPAFTFSVLPTSHIARPNQVVSYRLLVEHITEVEDPVVLGVTGGPPDVTALWSENPVMPDADITLTINLVPTTPLGYYALTVTGISGSDEVSRSVGLWVPWFSSIPFAVK